jgi:hypothetical protein
MGSMMGSSLSWKTVDRISSPEAEHLRRFHAFTWQQNRVGPRALRVSLDPEQENMARLVKTNVSGGRHRCAADS